MLQKSRATCLLCLRAINLVKRENTDYKVDPRTGLKRTLTTVDLTLIGVGGIIGAGVYVLSGQAAARYAGPAVVLSFVLSGVACFFCALCYSELATMVPASGSAYSFANACLGPYVGFAVGWVLMLEYLVGASTVAVGWSGYVNSLLKDMGTSLPPSIAAAPYLRLDDGVTWVATGGVVNLPAVAVCLLATALQVRGIQESATFNNVVVVVKVGVLLLFIICCVWYVKPENYSPFVPPEQDGRYGFIGILKGSSAVFFAYIGFDAISTASAEAIDPQASLPIATMASLGIATLLYIVVGFVITGLVRYTDLAVPDPIAVTVNAAGPSLAGLRPIIKLGALFGLTSVIVVLILGQARVFFAMADDGNLPAVFARVHPVYKTPWVTTLVTGALAALLAGLLPVDVLAEMVSIGTLAAFVVACLGVIALRRARPELHRPFAVPCSPFFPAAGAILSLVQIFVLPYDTLWRLAVWMAAGALVYVGYSRHHAKPWEEVYGRMLLDSSSSSSRAEGEKAAAQTEREGRHSSSSSSSSTPAKEAAPQAPQAAQEQLPPATLDW